MCRQLTSVTIVLLITAVAPCVYGQLPTGWKAANIGNPSVAGSVQYAPVSQTWTIQGDGTGIRGATDQCYYVYKTLSGDGELAARVAGVEPPLSDWSMAGVMIRVLLDNYSPYIFMGVAADTDAQDHAIVVAGRQAPFGAVEIEATGTTGAPYWVKVKRVGNTFSAYSSPDGKEWTQRNSTVAAGIPKDIFIGYLVTSEVAGKLVTAVFDQGPTKAGNPTPADKAVDVSIPVLGWTPGVVTAFHELYFGTNPVPGPNEYVGRLGLTQTVYVPATMLTPETTYYWRVDEVGADGVTIFTGDVWQFTSAPLTAYGPTPWNNYRGVDVFTNLAWNAALNADSHDVYFGTNRAAVRAGDASVFKGNQLMTVYDPGMLAESTTYYWRIDERTEDGAVRPGPVWSFTTIGPGMGVKAEYFAGTEPVGVPVLTSVETAINHAWGSGKIAAELSDSVSARWTANLEVPFSGTYQLITTTDDGVRLWLDGRLLINNWTTHGSTDDTANVSLVVGNTYFLQMEYFENTGSATAVLSWQGPSIARQAIPAGPLQVPLWAASPYPMNTAVNVPQTLSLHWRAGDDATHHDIYFGDDPDAVADADSTTAGVYRLRQAAGATKYDPGVLESGKTYYWRVDEVNDASADSPWRGSVWSFTTAEFIVVDDFENYTNEVGNRVFQTWLDGYGFTEPQVVEGNGTNGVIGNDIWAVGGAHYRGTIAETRVVHSGAQSTPMDYNNVRTPYYSETQRTWTATQNWTLDGMNTLVLYIKGIASNTPAPLYVALRDNSQRIHIVVHNDPAVLTETQWIEWKIPLATFTNAGVNGSAVKTMYIGMGDRNAPKPGGAGTVYIDDIRVIKAE